MSQLSCGLIAPRLFPTRQWFYAGPWWYYHAPAVFHQLRVDRRFYELVDPALRELCRRLLAAGLRTTPSCQGHFYERPRFERVWDQLSREAGAVRTAGLVVRDCENGRARLFRDPLYRLPWPHFEAFYDDAARRFQRVLTADPATAIFRHADAGYERAIGVTRRFSIDLPSEVR